VLLAAALRIFNSHRLPIIHYPIVWELAAGVILVAAGFALVHFANTPAVLTKQNALTFLNWNRNIIATGDENTLAELGHDIRNSLELVAVQCSAYGKRRLAAELAHSPGAEAAVEADELTRVCFTLLDAWSDPKFCNVIVRQCPGTFMEIFDALSKHGAIDSARHLGSELIHQSFSDKRSIVHRETGFSGFGRHKQFLNQIFGNPRILRSEVRPLEAWRAYKDVEISSEKIERWKDALTIALKTVIRGRNFELDAYVVQQGLDTLNSASLFLLATKERQSLADNDPAVRPIAEIDSAFEEAIKLLATSASGLEDASTPETYEQLGDRTIHGVIAKELFDHYGQVSAINSWSVLHSATLGSFMALFPHHDGDVTPDLKALQVRMLYHFKRKIADNLDPNRTYYPAITKMLLTLGALHAPQREACCTLEYELLSHFRDEFISKFATLWERNSKFASDMLPSDMNYDPDRFVIRNDRFRRRDVEEIQLNAPLHT
jgi:hypothetical protein